MRIEFLEMDHRALDYVRSELEATNALGRLILSGTNWDYGRTYGVLPKDRKSDIYKFRWAIFTPRPEARTPVPGGHIQAVPSTESEVASWIRGILQSDPRRAFVCESFLLRAEDLGQASHLPMHTIAYGEFVYHWAVHDDPAAAVDDAVRRTYPVPLGFAVICTISEEYIQRVKTGIMDADVVTAVVKGTHCILVGAYDGESVVLWLANDAPFSVPQG